MKIRVFLYLDCLEGIDEQIVTGFVKWASTLTLQAQLSKEPAQNKRNVSFLLSKNVGQYFPKDNRKIYKVTEDKEYVIQYKRRP